MGLNPPIRPNPGRSEARWYREARDAGYAEIRALNHFDLARFHLASWILGRRLFRIVRDIYLNEGRLQAASKLPPVKPKSRS